jgi:hypothetical protein
MAAEPDGRPPRQSMVIAARTEMKRAVVASFVTCLAAAMDAPANAADAFYIGAWKISGAVAAPWADPKRKSDNAEPSRLLDKVIVFRAKDIAGPPPFACRAPHYKESEFTAAMIFQGAFEEMQSKNKSIDPNTIAASLGFAEKSIRTLETGCEIDFHFVDTVTAEIGLNDFVYTLKKQ